MAIININLNLDRVFKTVQEGIRPLEITKVEVIPSGAPKLVKIYARDIEDGATLTARYDITNSTGSWKLGMLLHYALGLTDGVAFDTNDLNKLIGAKVKCEIVHSTTGDKTYANIKRTIGAVDDDAEMTKLAEDTANLLYSRSDLDTEDDLD